jgi:addiction module HigA family antidote
MSKILPPIHPGEVLKEEFLVPLGFSINKLALDLHIAPSRVSMIVNQRRSITAETAMRLDRYFGTSAEFWLNLQSRYDLLRAKQEREKAIQKEVRPRPAELARASG